jgi:cobalt-zinc-cadmium efflux system outer membrane protein
MRCSFVRVSGRRRGQFLLVFFLAAGPATAGAGEPRTVAVPAATSDESPATVVKMTWPDIARLADRHPIVAAGNFQIDAARAGVNAAGAVPNPTLEATGGKGLARIGDDSRGEWGLALSVPLGWIAQRRSKIDAARAEVDLAMAEGKTLRRDVLLQLRTLFWSLADEQATVASLEVLEAQTSALVHTVKRRVEKGEARPVEATRVEIELEKVTSELEAAGTSLSARRAELALWLGVPAGNMLVAVADLDALPVAPDRDTALAKARTTHPALALARARTRSLEAEVGTEKMARVPSLSITGFTTSELDRQAYGVGLAVDVPVWNWNSGRIAQAEAKLAAENKKAAATALEVESTVIQAQAACRTSVATATRQKDRVVPLSTTAASTMERTYQLGEVSLLEVIDARRTLLDSRRLYSSALAKAHIDCSRLGALVGEELP